MSNDILRKLTEKRNAILGGADDDTIEKTMWGSPAGKKKIANKLVALIPAHKAYIEPFAGSGAVFFAKEAVPTEVLNDMDPDIAFAYQALKTLTPGELDSLRKKDWTGNKEYFKKLSKSEPSGKVDRLYKFLYTSHFAYGKLRGKSFNPNADGVESTAIKRIEKHQKRLKNAIVRSGTYSPLIKEFDGKDSFFFLDPPYPGYDVNVGEGKFDEGEFRKQLKAIKGKFLVTYGVRGKLDTSDFYVKKIRPPRSIRTMRGVGGPKMLTQLVIANYPFDGGVKKSVGDDDWEIVDVDDYQFSRDDVFKITAARGITMALEAELNPFVDTLAEIGVSGAPMDLLTAARATTAELSKSFDDIDGGDATDAALLVETLARNTGDALAELNAELMPTHLAGAIVKARAALGKLTGAVLKAAWSTEYIDALPDSAFLYIADGGEKDDDDKTTPRSLRYFPVKDKDGAVDAPHLRDAISRIPESDADGLDEEKKTALQDKARALLEEANKETETAKAVSTGKPKKDSDIKFGDSAGQKMQAVQAALNAKYPPPSDKSWCIPWICDLFDDTVVYASGGYGDSKLWGVKYAYEDGEARLVGAPAEVKRTYATVKKVLKAEEASSEERYVLGIVLEPDVVDAQKDTYDAPTIAAAAHEYMVKYQNRGLMHEKNVNDKVQLVESYIAPVDFKVGDQEIKKGTWLMAVKVLDDKIWKDVKGGKLTGFSIGGTAVREPEQN